MEYFKLLKNQVDIVPLLEEIAQNEDAWLVNTNRQDRVSDQRETQTIALRKAVDREDLNINENQESDWTELAQRFPLACQFMQQIAEEEGGTLSRGVIVRLQPKGAVYLHTDHGAYYLIRKRYHLVLKSALGSSLMSGGELVKMTEGQLWWFDNSQYHQATNKSDEWRIHYIFDVLPHEYASLGKNPISPNEISHRLKKAGG